MHLRTRIVNGQDLEVLNLTKPEIAALYKSRRILVQIQKHGSPLSQKSAGEAVAALDQAVSFVEKMGEEVEA